MYILEPKVQIRSDCLILYNQPTSRPGRKLQLSQKPTYSGKVTHHAAKRIKKAIDILVQKNAPKTIWNPVTKKNFPFQFNFITLTISSKQNVSNKIAYNNLLKPFLRIMRKEGKFSYIWKAEFQKRGQLHYHLATNTFLTWQLIRSTWNNLQRKNRLLDDYGLKYGHFDPNSTDVHAKSNCGHMAKYMSKYLCKNNTQSLKGKVWDCSQDLNIPRFSFTPTYQQEIDISQLVEDNHAEVVPLEHCTIVKMPNHRRIMTQLQAVNYLNWQS